MIKNKGMLFLFKCSNQFPFENKAVSFFSCHYDVNNFKNSLFSEFNISNKVCSTRTG